MCCIFCDIINRKTPSTILSESENFIVIEDVNPISKGHCLIITKKHYQNLLEIPESIGNEMIRIMKKESKRLIDNNLGSGIKIIQNNFEAAGQTVNHFHIHLIPFHTQ